MTSANLQRLVAPWTLAELQANCAKLGPPDRAALRRAWFATHREEWLLGCFPEQTAYGFDARPRRQLLQRFQAIPAYRDRRAPHRYCAEFYRGCGKTALLRLELLIGRFLHDEETSAVVVNQNKDFANEHTGSLMELIPERRARPKGAPDSWFASLYPGVEWTGSVEILTIHVPYLPGLNDAPSDHVIYTRGISSGLKGFLSRGMVRPSALYLDDIQTADTARSPKENNRVWRTMTQEAAGISAERTPISIVKLCNALFLDDASSRAEADPGWIHDRIGVWEHPPEETPLVRELEALWHSTDGSPERKNAAVFAHPRAAEIEALTVMADPYRSVLWGLCERWGMGRAPFARIMECQRTTSGERTFNLTGAQLLCTLGPSVIRADNTLVQMADLDISIWLDPRFSKHATKNDFAAVVAVGKDAQGRRYTLDATVERDRGSASRKRVWTMLDKLLALGADPRRLRIDYETNGGAEGTYEETFDEDVVARRREGLFCPPITGHNSTGSKLDRIETMEDPLHAGRWQIARHLVGTELWQQLLLVPHGTHDDGPDAMERAGNMLNQPQGGSMGSLYEHEW